MALYARLDRAAVEGLARRFGIDDITDFSALDGGCENSNYCVETDSGKHVLTLFDQKSLKHATNLANLLIYLTDRGIRTSRVVVPPEEPIVILHDGKPVMLKHHVDGDIAANLTGDLLVQLGEEMARLHEISAPSYLPESFPYGRSYFPEVINSNLDHAYIDWLNMIVKGDQLMAIIDFEEACHYYRSFDLGMVIVGACRNREGISFRKAKQFLRGYQNDRTLEPVERESLKAFAVYAAVATSF